MDFGLINRKH